MESSTIQSLNQINSDFYKTTYQYLNHTDWIYRLGWDQLTFYIQSLSEPLDVLDIGCGDGRFGVFLNKKQIALKSYIGVDNFKPNLELAHSKLVRLNLERLDLIQDDLIENVNWFSGLSITPNLITAFGIFHHIPSHKLRLELMANICSLIQAGDLLIWSVFQYLDIPRLRRQVLDLKNQEIINFLHHKFNLDTFDLEFGDNILKWRMVLGKTNVIESYRYSHYFSVDHVQDLLTVGNLNLISDFVEQDKEGGTNRYLVCVKI